MNQLLLKRVAKSAEETNCTTSWSALAWVIHQGAPIALPIPKTAKVKNLASDVASLGGKFTEEEMEALEDSVPASEVVGERYAAEMTSMGCNNSTPLFLENYVNGLTFSALFETRPPSRNCHNGTPGTKSELYGFCTWFECS